MREKDYSAFTLVELLIVAIIIGLLSSLALATYARYKEHAVRTRIFAAVEEWNRVHSVFLANSLMPPDARLSKKESPREAAMEAYSILRGYIPSIEKYATLEDFELEVAFSLLKNRYYKSENDSGVYDNTRQLVYELPYFIQQRQKTGKDVVDIIREVCSIRGLGDDEEKAALDNEIETAYLEKEIERMYDRLAKTGRDTSVVSYKLSRLKRRQGKL